VAQTSSPEVLDENFRFVAQESDVRLGVLVV
jgi:hypothetical protein